MRKDGCTNNASFAASKARCVSGVTNEPSDVPDDVEGCRDTCSSPSLPSEQPVAVVDWSSLTILETPADDGLATQLVDEDKVYEAIGFMEAEATEEAADREEVPIPGMTAEMQADMNEAAVNVDDTIEEEPMYEWDKDNLDMSVGISYPSMDEFRLVVRQHAIVKEFELGTEHLDKERFRGCCAALGCPWKIRARTQHDGSVRVYFLQCFVDTSFIFQ